MEDQDGQGHAEEGVVRGAVPQRVHEEEPGDDASGEGDADGEERGGEF